LADKGRSGQFDPEAGSVGESVEARLAEIALDGTDSCSHAITTSQHDGPGLRTHLVGPGSIQVGCMDETASAQDPAQDSDLMDDL
jgi:hypothetical protein